MKFVFIFGPGAVGKMSVGQALKKQTGFPLFHNHSSIEPVLEIFGEFNSSVIFKFREIVFDEFYNGNYKGAIFTMIWALDEPNDIKLVDDLYHRFTDENHEFYIVELCAPQETRLERNKTPNRLQNKPSKRDLEQSEKRLIHIDDNHRCNSRDGEIKYPNYLKIDNTTLEPETVAKLIIEKFKI